LEAIAFAPLVPRAAEAVRLFHERYSQSEEQRVATLSRLLDTEERMKLAVESGGIGTWDYNPITNELHWDDRCRAVFGASNHQQASYEDLISRVHPEDRAHVEALLNGALSENREYNAGFRVVTDVGDTRHVIARGKLFCNEARKPARLTGTVIDVTKERQAEEALLRTEKLAVAGRMAASIAHEINNPLHAAIGLVYIARTEDGVPESVKERLQAVEH
jgi:PAS domain S-box-containing protein